MDILNGAVVEKDPKPLVVFSVAVDTMMLFSCTSFWMFMAVTARDSDLSHVKLLERTSLQEYWDIRIVTRCVLPKKHCVLQAVNELCFIFISLKKKLFPRLRTV